jgi:hypothetical protein
MVLLDRRLNEQRLAGRYSGAAAATQAASEIPATLL